MSLGIISAHYAAAGNSYASAVLGDSPMLYWRLAGNGNDASGNGRNASSGVIGTTAASLVPTSSDAAMTFNGSTQYYSESYGSWMNTTALTLETLIKTTATATSQIASRDGGAGRVFQFRVEAGKATFVRIFNSGGGLAVVSVSSIASINDGVIHHVAVTYDGTTVKIYIDGVLDNTATASGGLYAISSEPLYLARYGDGTGPLAATLDEFAWYGTALSATQITAHYAEATATGSAFKTAMLLTSPSTWHRMDAYSSGFADLSGNGRALNTVSGVAPSSTSGGPKLGTAGEWGSSAGFLKETSSITSPTTGTFHCYLNVPSYPGADLCLQTVCPIVGNVNGGCNAVYLLSNGKIRLFLFNGSSVNLDSSSAVGTGAWHQIVCKWGPGGSSIRIDKVDAATGATTSATGIASSYYRVHGYYNGSADAAQTGAVKMAEVAYWHNTKLADSVTDGLFDAA